MKRIGIDCDGCVADYMAGAIPVLKEKYGLEPDYKVEAYTIEEVFGLTQETRPPDMRQTLYIEDNLFAKLPVLEEGNKELTSQLWASLGPDLKIYFVTARDNHPVIMRDQPWNRHLPAVPRGLEDNKGRLTRVYDWREMVEVAKEYYA